MKAVREQQPVPVDLHWSVNCSTGIIKSVTVKITLFKQQIYIFLSLLLMRLQVEKPNMVVHWAILLCWFVDVMRIVHEDVHVPTAF